MSGAKLKTAPEWEGGVRILFQGEGRRGEVGGLSGILGVTGNWWPQPRSFGLPRRWSRGPVNSLAPGRPVIRLISSILVWHMLIWSSIVGFWAELPTFIGMAAT